MFSFPPPIMPPILPDDTANAVVQYELSSREEILRKLHSNLQKAQTVMKRWADTSRRDLQFEVRDWVYVRLRPRR